MSKQTYHDRRRGRSYFMDLLETPDHAERSCSKPSREECIRMAEELGHVMNGREYDDVLDFISKDNPPVHHRVYCSRCKVAWIYGPFPHYRSDGNVLLGEYWNGPAIYTHCLDAVQTSLF